MTGLLALSGGAPGIAGSHIGSVLPFAIDAGAVLGAVLQVLIFVLMVILLMVLHELGHYAVAAASGLKVDRIVVGSPKGKILAQFGIRGQMVEIYRRVPVLMALDIDDNALIEAGFWRRVAFGAAGPITNFLLVLLTGWVYWGLVRGTSVGLDFISSTFQAIVTFFLSPFGVGSSADFFNGPLQQSLAAAQAGGIGTNASLWMMLNALIGVANVFPLPALDGGLVFVSLLMALVRKRESAAKAFDRWYGAAPRVAAWLPWVFVGFTVYHIVNLFV